MKKTYIQPAIELVAVEVEQGIAASGFGATVTGFTSEEDVW